MLDALTAPVATGDPQDGSCRHFHVVRLGVPTKPGYTELQDILRRLGVPDGPPCDTVLSGVGACLDATVAGRGNVLMLKRAIVAIMGQHQKFRWPRLYEPRQMAEDGQPELVLGLQDGELQQELQYFFDERKAKGSARIIINVADVARVKHCFSPVENQAMLSQVLKQLLGVVSGGDSGAAFYERLTRDFVGRLHLRSSQGSYSLKQTYKAHPTDAYACYKEPSPTSEVAEEKHDPSARAREVLSGIPLRMLRGDVILWRDDDYENFAAGDFLSSLRLVGTWTMGQCFNKIVSFHGT